jgi:hypothetical protein
VGTEALRGEGWELSRGMGSVRQGYRHAGKSDDPNSATESVTNEQRLEVLNTWINLTSKPQTSLLCFRCLADSSATDEAMSKNRTRYLFNQLPLSLYHTRRSQLRNAFNTYRSAGGFKKTSCFVCKTEDLKVREYKDSHKWPQHVKKHHPKHLQHQARCILCNVQYVISRAPHWYEPASHLFSLHQTTSMRSLGNFTLADHLVSVSIITTSPV